MELTHETVKGIAELAKLALTNDEIALYADQLSHILRYFEKLQTLDTAHIEPTASVLPLANVMRADTPQPPLTPEQVIRNAPDAYENQFRVSAVLPD